MEVIFKNQFNKWTSIEHYDYNALPTEVIFGKETLDFTDFELLMNPSKYGNWKFKSSHNSEEIFKKNYGNPCYTVLFQSTIIVLEKSDTKVSIKIFNNSRTRNVGKIFFTKTTNLRYLTFNKVTKNLYYGNIENYHKKRKSRKTLSKNTFYKRPINRFTNHLNSVLNSWVDELTEEQLGKNNIIKNYIYNFLRFCGVEDTEIEKTNELSLNGDKILFKKNLEKKGIKMSDNFDVFIEEAPNFTSKEIKVAKKKLIDLVMNRHNIKGGKFKKSMHRINKFNPFFLKYAISLFGEENIKSLKDEQIIKILSSNFDCMGFRFIEIYNRSELFRNNKKTFEIFKLVIEGHLNFESFRDHLRFFYLLRRYEPNLKWNSHNKKTFVEEHLDFSEKLEEYHNGSYYRIYSEEFLKLFETSIWCEEDEFKAILLQDSKSYIEESHTQSNCVRNYVNNPNCFIISLRNDDERATIEYKIRKCDKSNKILSERVQTLGRFNNKLSESWEKPLSYLDNRISNFFSQGKFKLPELEVTFKNGVVKRTKSIFTETENFPKWEEDIYVSDNYNFDLYYFREEF